MIRLGNQHVDIEMALSLISLLRQYVPRMRMAPLDFSGRRQAHSLGRTFVGLKFGHNCSFLLIADFQLPIADFSDFDSANRQLEIGNWQSSLGGRSLRLRAAALVSLWSKDDEHLVPFHPWPRFNLTNIDEIALEPLQNSRA